MIQFPLFQPTITDSGLKHFGISLQSVRPCHSLKHIVHSYLQIRVEKPIGYSVIPDGTQAVFISPRGSLVGGAQSQRFELTLNKGVYFGIRFFPGALRYFFKLDVSEITNQLVDSKDFPCKYFADLHCRIYQYTAFLERAEVCERWLLQRFQSRDAGSFELALKFIFQSKGGMKINCLAKKVGWSDRHLNRIFLQYTGLNTKTFSNIIRLQNICEALCSESRRSLMPIFDSGYCDQSHLIKSFKKTFLLTPRDFINYHMSDFYNQ